MIDDFCITVQLFASAQVRLCAVARDAEEQQLSIINYPSSMKIDVEKMAHLARLELTAEEVAEFQREIEEVLGYCEQLKQIDVEGVEPTAHATRISNVTAQDEPGKTLERDGVLANAPALIEGDLIRVPKVVDDGGAA
jgi:aspartyl-tRNA(Asn)/glutamyl-tRNA(Gln) amidotransferase subunit C